MADQEAAALLKMGLASLLGPSGIDQSDAIAIDDVRASVQAAPSNEEEIAALLRFAGERDLVVVPSGGQTKLHTGGVTDRIDILLSTQKLNLLEHYDPGDLTAGAQAGMPVRELQNHLAPHHQFLPFDASLPARATVGGLLATAAQGPLRHGYGAVRDYCIGICYVAGDGVIAKAGGRVVKNVAGYDLMKLLIGSYGSLAVITGASFKVFPQPQPTRTFVLAFPRLEAACGFRDKLIKSALTPICHELISPRAQEYLRDHAVSPPAGETSHPRAALLPSAWQLAIRAAGSDAVLARYRTELGGAVLRELNDAQDDHFWRRVRDFASQLHSMHRNCMIVQLNLTPQDVAGVLTTAGNIARDHNLLFASLGRAVIGTMFAGFIPLAVEPPSAMQFAEAANAMRAALPPHASMIVLRCPTESKRYLQVWGAPSGDLALARRIKQALDPKNTLNRGRFVV